MSKYSAQHIAVSLNLRSSSEHETEFYIHLKQQIKL